MANTDVLSTIDDLMTVFLNSTLSPTSTLLSSSSDDGIVEEMEEESPMAYRRISFAIAWLTLALCIFGLIGNVFSIIIYAHPSMRSPVNVLLMGTSYIDFILSLLAIPTFVIPGINAYYQSPSLTTVQSLATAYVYPLCITMQSASVWAFVVITVERYHAVCTPFRAKWSSIQRSRAALIIVCASAIAYNAVRFFEFRLEYGTRVDGNTTAGSNETLATPFYYVEAVMALRSIRSYMNIYYIGLFLVTHFFCPFLVLVVLNGLIVRTICQSRQRRRLLNRKERSEHRTAIMMVIVVSTFMVCYTLLFILNILDAANPDLFYDPRYMALLFALNDISNTLVVANAASSIIVYYFFSTKYRQLLIGLLGRMCPAGCVKYMEMAGDQVQAVGGPGGGHDDEHAPGAAGGTATADRRNKIDEERTTTALLPLLSGSDGHLKPNGGMLEGRRSFDSNLLTPTPSPNAAKMNSSLVITNYAPSSLSMADDASDLEES